MYTRYRFYSYLLDITRKWFGYLVSSNEKYTASTSINDT